MIGSARGTLDSSSSGETPYSSLKPNNKNQLLSPDRQTLPFEKQLREVGRYAREELFKFVKFITFEEQLLYTGKFYNLDYCYF